MPGSVAIIGAGQIGIAASHAFAASGWRVRVHSRSPSQLLHRDAQFVPYVAGESAAPSADVILDTIAFDEDDITRYDPGKVGRLIVVSSASVYCDDKGRTLDEAAQNGFPEFAGPITEDQQTVSAGPETYSTRKIRMENKALELFVERATILRPCAIYGVGNHPREWWFIKRMIDGRRHIPLARMGRSQFQPTSVEDIAFFSRQAAQDGLGGIFNIADDKCPTVLQIGEAIGAALGFSGQFVGLDEAGTVGQTPWSVPRPFVVSNARMAKNFDRPVERYQRAIAPIAKMLADLDPADWRTAFPQLTAYPWDLFDYEAEDRFLASL